VRRYATDTAVPISRTRGDVLALLTEWGCSSIGWFDDFENGLAQLYFRWPRDGVTYSARFSISLPTDADLRQRARHATTRTFLPAKFKQLQAGRGRSEHRVLLLWLKAALNAVEAGIIDPALVFMPFLVGNNGKTVGEVLLPRLKDIHALPDAGHLMLGTSTC